ncbi:hypothetical protein Thein_1177 [Thermodesulfatator indicus DSM 15286]|uniref:Uncharacterized protein n=1 Tax=Thermodesulfatator indicus (strain DSM 15286 / JCM 11887 / CIR29812) TaxID=667014 RepID=F8A850_THEID|nr:hypothetical protein [Thermodesulfatator indicus]AEH45045.1 hypothetical protein Thein_1177 [Thermodesulfatator indicus DSM 15286]
MACKKIFSLVILLTCLGSLLGPTARAEKIRQNWWPLFFYQRSSDGSASELEILGPFFYSYSTPQEKGLALRPFLAEEEKDDQYDLYFLPPFGHYQRGDNYSRLRFIPFISADNNHSEKKRFRSFLLFFWGESKEGKKFSGFFPFYGKLYDFFGKDEIRFYLWPVYIRSRIDKNVSRTWFWPIYNRTDGPTLYQRKFWPIYGHRVKKDMYDRKFWLWPFFWKETFFLENGTGKREMFFPFWIEESSPDYHRYTVLWPFFRYFHNKKTNTKMWDFPRPFLRYGRGDDPYYREYKIWPLVGYRAREDSKRRFFLWPFFIFYEDVLGYSPKKIYYHGSRILLFSRFVKITDKKGHSLYEFGRLWPIAEAERRQDGSKVFFFPAIIPFHNRGIDLTIAPLLRLYENIHFPDGTVRSKALWGFYRHDTIGKEKIWELAFLVSYKHKPDAFELKFLNGLLGIGKENKDWHLRLFFLKLF